MKDEVSKVFKSLLSRRILISPGRSIIDMFVPGEELEGEVLRVTGEGRCLVRFKDVEIPARMRVQLTPSERIRVRVERVSPYVVLEILEGDDSSLRGVEGYLRKLLPLRESFGELIGDLNINLQSVINSFKEEKGGDYPTSFRMDNLHNLQSLIKMLMFHPDKKGHDFISDYILQSGIHYESKLARSLGTLDFSREILTGDLKGLLLEIIKEYLGGQRSEILFSGNSNTAWEGLVSSADRMLKNIELVQVLNHIMDERSNFIYLQIPIQLYEGAKTVEMWVQKKGKKRRGVYEGIRVVFFLNMNNFGNIRIDCLFTPLKISNDKIGGNTEERDVKVIFEVEDEKGAGYIDRHGHLLDKGLRALGFEPSIDVKVKKDWGGVEGYLSGVTDIFPDGMGILLSNTGRVLDVRI